MGSYYKKQLNDFVADQEVSAGVCLDIGGAQSPIKGRTKSWDVEDYKIVDLKVPHSESPAPDIVQDMNQPLSGEILDYEGKTDLIYALGLYDYIYNPNICSENIHRLLKEGGVAWIEWIFLYAHHNPIEDEGCRYSYGCIKNLMRQANLEIVEWVWKRPDPSNPYLQLFYQADGMRAARGFDHNVTGFFTKVTK